MKLKDFINGEEYEWEEVYLRERDDKSWVLTVDDKTVFGETVDLCFEEANMFAGKFAKTVYHMENYINE
jgi:hypothetical protein